MIPLLNGLSKEICLTCNWKLYINNNSVHVLIGQKGRWMWSTFVLLKYDWNSMSFNVFERTHKSINSEKILTSAHIKHVCMYSSMYSFCHCLFFRNQNLIYSSSKEAAFGVGKGTNTPHRSFVIENHCISSTTEPDWCHINVDLFWVAFSTQHFHYCFFITFVVAVFHWEIIL